MTTIDNINILQAFRKMLGMKPRKVINSNFHNLNFYTTTSKNINGRINVIDLVSNRIISWYYE